MTVIVAKCCPVTGDYWIASDSRTVDQYGNAFDDSLKLWEAGGCVAGVSGDTGLAHKLRRFVQHDIEGQGIETHEQVDRFASVCSAWWYELPVEERKDGYDLLLATPIGIYVVSCYGGFWRAPSWGAAFGGAMGEARAMLLYAERRQHERRALGEAPRDIDVPLLLTEVVEVCSQLVSGVGGPVRTKRVFHKPIE